MIRAAGPGDADAIATVAIEAGMFAPDDAPFLQDMMRSYFDGGRAAGHACVVDEADAAVLGVAYYQPRGIADRVWDLTMIAVRPAEQGRGRGAALLRHVEDDLGGRGQRLLLVETSGTAQYDRTRAFYAACGYDDEARVRDYWEQGDDLVLFRKELGGR